eukprot:TRINITY_DN16169_c0_g1_i3.p1 TRINITY_DN16169_c0_g1~~TRINITY_DN16169_c0_g1_i3.p1  ORF type:complete len:267 (+),score=41.63 TRINITY_DN16169_c0_g1_i3:132-932(+)
MLRSLVGSEMCIRDRRNISQWARLLNETGRAAVIENCHNGNNPAVAIDQGGCPDYHVFRTSGDIKNNYASWIGNALTVNDYAISNRTGPTCWAYPDMSMIGVQGQTPDEAPGGPWTNFSQPSITEQRTHFGLWAVLSSPLTLSLDFGNGSAVDGVWDLISNVELLRVNQAWAGGAGSIFAADHQRNVTLRSDCTRDLVVPSWQAWISDSFRRCPWVGRRHVSGGGCVGARGSGWNPCWIQRVEAREARFGVPHPSAGLDQVTRERY